MSRKYSLESSFHCKLCSFIKNIIRPFSKPIVQLFHKPSPGFIVKLSCGLGNQMFQYALGRAIAWRTGSKVHFDRSWFAHIPDRSSVRVFALDIFSLPARFVDKTGSPSETTLYNDPSKEFKKDILELKRGQNISFEGYWQSEKYFKDAEIIIRHDFSFRIPPDKENRVIIDKITADLSRGVEAVSLHVRRGDYCSDPNIGLLSLNYYETAMSVIEQRFPRVCYFVFSDDLQWCREHLRFKTEAVFVDVNTDKPDWMDMRLMSSCRHHIIANSSFSWWGAWLSTNKDKVVVAPSHQEWFSKYLVRKDILPDEWLEISTKKPEEIKAPQTG